MSLKDLRKAKGYTQVKLANAVSVTQRAIANYESGARKPKPDIAERIAEVLDLSIEDVWNMFYKTS